jgi:hypothetical protein
MIRHKINHILFISNILVCRLPLNNKLLLMIFNSKKSNDLIVNEVSKILKYKFH